MIKPARIKSKVSHRSIWICNTLFIFFLDRASPIPHMAGAPLPAADMQFNRGILASCSLDVEGSCFVSKASSLMLLTFNATQ